MFCWAVDLGASGARRELEDENDLFKYISFEKFSFVNLRKSLDSIGTETSSVLSAFSAFSAFSGCKFWSEDIKLKVKVVRPNVLASDTSSSNTRTCQCRNESWKMESFGEGQLGRGRWLMTQPHKKWKWYLPMTVQVGKNSGNFLNFPRRKLWHTINTRVWPVPSALKVKMIVQFNFFQQKL